MRSLNRWATGFIAATVEAWHELRIHKLRVLLSLVGVMVAVCSLTVALAAAAIGEQMLTEQYEHQGRPAMLSVNAWSNQGMPPRPEVMRPAAAKAAEKMKITYASMSSGTGMQFGSATASEDAWIQVIEPDYAVLHRLVPAQGRWLTDADADNMSPAVVIGQRLVKKLGLAGRVPPFTITLGRGLPVEATVVGTLPAGEFGEGAYMLADAYERWFGADQPLTEATYEMWVPPSRAKELSAALRGVLASELPGYQVQVDRNDYLAWNDHDPLREVRLVVGAIAGVILLLGALSLLNVALVTIQQRVREVGIRRSFGATTGRVFFSVMMESVVATVVAGAVGVMLAVALVTNPWTAKKLLNGLDDVPAFPLDAAFIGLGVSIAVGVLAGVLPALIAARVKIVDAIRF